MKDLGKLKLFLGIEVIDVENGIYLTQRKYCLDLLHEFIMLGSKPVKTSLYPNVVIRNEGVDRFDSLLQNITEFQRLIGKLIYLTITRPYISYIVQVSSQCMHSPRKSHLNITMRLLRYLKSNLGKDINVSKSKNLILKSYVDVDWEKCLVCNRSN